MTFGSLFSGIGGMDLGLERAGMACMWQVEIKPYARRVLAKNWPQVKRFEDIRELFLFDAEGWRFINEPEPVDVLCGGFPCQDISHAGKGIGIVGERSGLWSEFARLVAELRPEIVFAENVPALRNRGLALVLQDLWSLGYDAEWHCIPASAFGAPHERDRIWIIAYPNHRRELQQKRCLGQRGRWVSHSTEKNADHDGGGCNGWPWHKRQDGRLEFANSDNTNADYDCSGREEQRRGFPIRAEQLAIECCDWWTTEPGVVRMVHGVPNRVDRLAGLGNAVVPQVAQWVGERIIAAYESVQ